MFPYVAGRARLFRQQDPARRADPDRGSLRQVQDALSFFVTVYRTMAEWRAVVARLDGFESSIRQRRKARGRSAARSTVVATPRSEITLPQLLVKLPNGAPLVAADHFSLRPGERTLVTGPSGAGKSTLFRAIAGIWPFGEGAIDDSRQRHPDDAAAASVLPDRNAARGDRLSRRRTQALAPTGSGKSSRRSACRNLAARLDEEAHWNRMLSLGEQQRLGLARALLHTPSTSSSTKPPRRSTSPRKRRCTPADGEIASDNHRLDRPSLNAGSLP